MILECSPILNGGIFTDWAVGFDNGIPPGADDGHSACVSLQYVYAIQKAILS